MKCLCDLIANPPKNRGSMSCNIIACGWDIRRIIGVHACVKLYAVYHIQYAYVCGALCLVLFISFCGGVGVSYDRIHQYHAGFLYLRHTITLAPGKLDNMGELILSIINSWKEYDKTLLIYFYVRSTLSNFLTILNFETACLRLRVRKIPMVIRLPWNTGYFLLFAIAQMCEFIQQFNPDGCISMA